MFWPSTIWIVPVNGVRITRLTDEKDDRKSLARSRTETEDPIFESFERQLGDLAYKLLNTHGNSSSSSVHWFFTMYALVPILSSILKYNIYISVCICIYIYICICLYMY